MTSWRPFCSLSYAALSRSQFWSDFLQNWWVGRKLSSAVCYLKSARSVGNFCQYGGPRFQKKIKMATKNKKLKQGKWGVYFDWNWPADHEYDNTGIIWNYALHKWATFSNGAHCLKFINILYLLQTFILWNPRSIDLPFNPSCMYTVTCASGSFLFVLFF